MADFVINACQSPSKTNLIYQLKYQPIKYAWVRTTGSKQLQSPAIIEDSQGEKVLWIFTVYEWNLINNYIV